MLWLKKNGYYKDFKAGIERDGRNFIKTLNDMHVSRIVARCLLEVYPGFATSEAEARKFLNAQFPPKEDTEAPSSPSE